MAGTTLGTAYVQIVPSAQGISGSISNALSGEATAAGTKTGGLFSKLFSSKVAKGAAIAGGAIAAGVGIGAAALKKGISDTAAYGDNIDKMSQKIGFTAEEYQKWDYVLQRAGTDIGKMAPVMKTLANAATSNSAAFQELGISQEQVAKMSQGELFSETIKQLSQMEAGAERTALASKLLGRGATELGPLLNEGSSAIQDQMDIAEKYGMIMSDSAVKASADFQDSVTTMQMTMTGLKNRMLAEFLPATTQITDGLGQMFAGDMSGVDNVVAGIQGVVSKIGEMAPQILQAGAHLIGQLIQGLMSRSGEIGEKAGSLAMTILTKLIEKAPSILAGGVTLIAGLAQGLIAGLPKVIASVAKIGFAIIKGLGSALWGKVTAAANGIKERFLAPVNALKDKVKGIIDKIKGFFPINVGKILKSIKIPKFSISGKFSLNPPSIPKISMDWVNWYKDGGIFDSPSLIGVGEAGPEAILPLDPFWKKLEQMGGSQTNEVTINVYASEGMSVTDIATEVERRLINATNKRRLAWQ